MFVGQAQKKFMGTKEFFDDEDKNRIEAEFDSLVKNCIRCNKPGDREMNEKTFRIKKKHN